MSGDEERPEARVDAQDVRIRAVWETLASPVSIAFATDESVVLLDGAAASTLAAADGVLEVGALRVRGTAEQLSELVDEARRAAQREYLELGDVDVVHVDGQIELRRGSHVELRESAPNVVAELLEKEKGGWRSRGVNYAKWSFTCGDNYFVTSPLRAAFVIDRIVAALDRDRRK